GVIHHRQRLPLGFKARDDLSTVPTRFYDLRRDPPRDRPFLLGHVHHAHAPFADFLQELVWAHALDGRRRMSGIAGRIKRPLMRSIERTLVILGTRCGWLD